MENIIQQVDLEIERLQKVRTILSGTRDGEHKPLRPAAHKLHLLPKKRRKMSAEGRAKISAAAKLRWKKQKAKQAA